MTIANEHHGQYEGAYSQQAGAGSAQIGWLQSAITSIVEGYRIRRQRREDRAAFENLLQLDDNLLKDIGIDKADVTWAAQLPVHVNASNELNKISHRDGAMFL